jgi:hypothetical protein
VQRMQEVVQGISSTLAPSSHPLTLDAGEQSSAQVRVKRGANSRVALLEESAQCMEMMAEQLKQLSAERTVKDRQIEQLQEKLNLLTSTSLYFPPQLTPSSTTSLTSSPCAGEYREENVEKRESGGASCRSPLPSLTFLSSTGLSSPSSSIRLVIRPLVSLLLLSLPFFRILDVNAQHEVESGWPTSQLLHRLFVWKQGQNPAKADHRFRSLFVWKDSLDSSEEDFAPLVHQMGTRLQKGGELAPPRVVQYESSKREVREVLLGNKPKCDCVWRLQKGDGCVYETQVSFWLGARDGQSLVRDEGERQMQTQPISGYLLVAVAYQNAIRMDDSVDSH